MEGALGTGASFTSAMPRVTAELVAIAPTARPNTARSAAARSRRRWRTLAVISLCPASYDSSITCACYGVDIAFSFVVDGFPRSGRCTGHRPDATPRRCVASRPA